MLSRWLDTRTLDPAAVTVVDPARADAPASTVLLHEIPEDVTPADTLLIGVKPQSLSEIAPAAARLVDGRTTILSILAGVERQALAALFPDARRIVRVMPNLPVRFGKGVVAVQAEHGPFADIDALMAPLGLVEWIGEEDFALVTALSGSGPAFIYRFIDALAEGATQLGLEPGLARRMAVATAEGAAIAAAQSEEPPAVLADRVASKGGSTRMGLDVLDAEGALASLVACTLDAARRRNIELGTVAAEGADLPG